ncbi:hypothetical protein K525DRAFT_192602 [Schizophyllum commune Loenen D]|nr:hypothetical protein K525DRAFT_192602 [Schizophyllum commune Loenen D]
MSTAASAFTPTLNFSPSSSVPCCTPDCALVTDSHLRGKTSRSVVLGDIRKTQTSLMAPFHAIMDAASQEAKENRLPRPPSTLGSRSGVSSSVPPSVANTSRISTIDGGKVRPCIILGLYGNIARVCLMGTFGGAFIDELSPELQEHVSVMFSPTCKRQGNWLQERKIFHIHSTPEWSHVEGKVQYVVPLVLEIGLDAVNKRWAVDRKLAGHSAGGAEGYYVDMKNMARLRIYASTMSRDLQSQCRDWKYRKNLRYVVEKKPVIQAPFNPQRQVGRKSTLMRLAQEAQRNFGNGNFLLSDRDHCVDGLGTNRLLLLAQRKV